VFCPEVVLVLALAGSAIGFLSGLLGMGGGSLMIPVLILVFSGLALGPDLSVKMAFGTNLLVGTVTALTGFLVHRRYQSRVWPLVLPLAGGSVAGALAGSTAASHLPGGVLKTLFGCTVGLVGVHLLVRREPQATAVRSLSLPLLLVLGLCIGCAASLVGLGGAVFTTVILVGVLHYPMASAVGVSTFVQTSGALSATIGYMLNGLGRPGLPPYSIGYVNVLAATVMMAPGIPLARVGARLAHRLRSALLERIFAVVLIAIAIAMVWGGS